MLTTADLQGPSQPPFHPLLLSSHLSVVLTSLLSPQASRAALSGQKQLRVQAGQVDETASLASRLRDDLLPAGAQARKNWSRALGEQEESKVGPDKGQQRGWSKS